MAYAAANKKSAILIVDKNNLIGGSLAEKLSNNATIVFVSRHPFVGEGDIVSISFSQSVPKIPDGLYDNIFFVWDREAESILDPLIRKAKEQGSRFFLIVDKEDRENIKEKSGLQGIRIVVLGDLFGKMTDFPLEAFLLHVKKTKKISLLHMGLVHWYPILLTDVVEKIAETYESLKVDTSYFFGPKHPITALSLAHGLQKIDPTISIDFSKESEKKRSEIEKERVMFEEYNSIEKIKNAYRNMVIGKQRNAGESAKITYPQNKKMNGGSGWIWYAFYVLCLFLFLPFLLGIGSGGLGALFLSSGFMDMKRGDITIAGQKTNAARQCFFLSKEALSFSSMELSVVGRGDILEPLQTKISLGYRISQMFEDGILIVGRTASVLNGKTLSPKNDISDAVGAAKHLSLLVQEVSLDDLPKQYQSDFAELQKLSVVMSTVMDEMPSIFGVQGDRSYLILFQNNMELRPGGGFIGSYGLLKLHNGAIKDFSIHDVYDADGQLKGHVEPPFALRRYIPVVHLYLRDSNFNPDFAENARTAAFLLSQETGDKADGVIGIDLETIRAALTAVGSVYVPSYNETVTQENFFPLIEKHAEKNFFPGSTQKKDFLNAFFASLIDAFEKHKLVNGQALVGQIVGLLGGKHVLVAFSDPLTQAPFSLANLSGELSNGSATDSAGIADFLGISEANLGINKVNAFVSRKLSHEVIVNEKGSIEETAILSLTNDSDGSWPGGVYRNYIRFILSKDTSIKSINTDNVEQHIVAAVTDPSIYEKKSFIPPAGLEVAREVEDGKSLFGFLVTVPQKSTVSIRIVYELPAKISPDQLEQKYSLVIWKQPGISSYPYNLRLILPKSMQLLKSSAPVAKQDDVVSLTSTIASDERMDFTLTKK